MGTHDGFDSHDLAPLPARHEIGARRRDRALLHMYEVRKASLAEIAREFELASPKAAQAAINRALRRLDKRMRADADSIRAREFVRLEGWQQRLEDENARLDHKTVAELRLLSESKRRLYGIDLQREVEGGPETIVVDVRFPWERGETIDGEAEEIPPAGGPVPAGPRSQLGQGGASVDGDEGDGD